MRHLPLPLLEDMAVGVRRQHDGAVPEEGLDVLKAEALRLQERRSGVAQVVEAEAWQPSAVEGILECPGDRGRS